MQKLTPACGQLLRGGTIKSFEMLDLTYSEAMETAEGETDPGAPQAGPANTAPTPSAAREEPATRWAMPFLDVGLAGALVVEVAVEATCCARDIFGGSGLILRPTRAVLVGAVVAASTVAQHTAARRGGKGSVAEVVSTWLSPVTRSRSSPASLWARERRALKKRR